MNEVTLELFKNKEFVEKVVTMEPDEALKEFHKEGSDITLEELVQIGEEVNANLQNKDELTESDLENVAGGKVRDAVHFAAGMVIGFCGVGVICCGW